MLLITACPRFGDCNFRDTERTQNISLSIFCIKYAHQLTFSLTQTYYCVGAFTSFWYDDQIVRPSYSTINHQLLSVTGWVFYKRHIYIGGRNSARFIITSSNGNIVRVTGPLWWQITGRRWIPLKMASKAGFGVFSDVSLNKWLHKQLRAGELRRHRAHYDVTVMQNFTHLSLHPMHTVVKGLVTLSLKTTGYITKSNSWTVEKALPGTKWFLLFFNGAI